MVPPRIKCQTCGTIQEASGHIQRMVEAGVAVFCTNCKNGQPHEVVQTEGKKLFRVPCSWQMFGYFECYAEDWDDAIEQAKEGSLPDGDYIDDSFEVDTDRIEEMKGEEDKE